MELKTQRWTAKKKTELILQMIKGEKRLADVCRENDLAATVGLPEQIVLDNGPEFICHVVADWAEENGVELAFIEKGKPQQNAFIESFNGTFRDERLNEHLFQNILDARTISGEWREHYNNERPHSALGGIPPSMFEERLKRSAA